MAGRNIDPRIKLRHIACFLEVVRFKSVVNAAEVLHISQPAASKTIQELEQLLGSALFDRTRRKLSPTPFGETFHRYAATSIAALRQGIDAASGVHETATVRVGALPTVSARVLPEAVRAFSAKHLLPTERGDIDLVPRNIVGEDGAGRCGETFRRRDQG